MPRASYGPRYGLRRILNLNRALRVSRCAEADLACHDCVPSRSVPIVSANADEGVWELWGYCALINRMRTAHRSIELHGTIYFPCAGNAGVFRLYLYARVRISFRKLHTRPRVQRGPGIPCTLLFEGEAGKPRTPIAPENAALYSLSGGESRSNSESPAIRKSLRNEWQE